VRFRHAIAVGLAAACLSAQATSAAEIEGVEFAEQLRLGDQELRLHGTGLLRYKVVFRGYVAALYLGDSLVGDATVSSVLTDEPRRLEIEYFWAIPAKEFAKATIAGISQSTDASTFETLRDRIEQLNVLYEDVEAGDRYAITYLPGVGTELARNGRSLGTIEGADFAKALFGIWLGDQPLDESLRSQLLMRR